MQVTRDQARVKEYLCYLRKEIDLVASMVGRNRVVTQLHWGGGTPTHLLPEDIRATAEYIRSAFRIHAQAEVSVEIDPRELTLEHVETLRQVGFNRVSLGIQDFDERVQRAVNRIQPRALTRRVFSWLGDLGFDGINVDLIYGLPFQTIGSFRQTLKETIRLAPSRIAVFNYAHVPWLKPHQKLIHPEDLPTPEVKLSILKETIEILSAAGYEFIGMDHFARSDDEMVVARREKTLNRNFQGYSTRAGADLYGLGMSAISHFGDAYAQNGRTLPEYYAALDAGSLPTVSGYLMNDDDRIRKYVIMRLMCDLEVDKRKVEEKFGIQFDSYFEDALVKLGEFRVDGIVDIESSRILVRDVGRLVLRNIAMCFDAYLDGIVRDHPVFSRTV
jgi:oxygen-independent coproporphyrinogen-3 oxidase